MNTGRHKPIMFTVISLLAVSLIYSSYSVSYTFAVPQDPRFNSGSTCNFDKVNEITCCWREQIPGSVLGEAYCQTCRYEESTKQHTDCDSKELQIRSLPEGDLPQLETVPPNRTLPDIGGTLEPIRPLPDTSDLPTLQTVPGPDLNQGTEGEPTLPVVCSEEAGLEKDPETGKCVPIEPGAGGGGMPTLEEVPQNRALPGGGELPTLQPGPGLNQGTEGEPTLPVVCSEEAGLEKDPETGKCVPIESPVTDDDEQPEEPEEQSSDNGGGGGGEEQSNEEEQPSEESDSELNGNN